MGKAGEPKGAGSPRGRGGAEAPRTHLGALRRDVPRRAAGRRCPLSLPLGRAAVRQFLT